MSAISQLNLLQAFGWALVNSLWQMALLWIIYKAIISFSTQIKPGKKTSLATFLIIAGFGWFIFTFISTLFFSAPGDLYNNWIGLVSEQTQVFYLGKILSAGTAVYLILLVIPVWKFIRNYQYVQMIRTEGLNKINADWKLFVRKTAENMGIVKKVQIWISDLVQSPVTVGFLKPVILIPVAAINQLTTQQVEAVILHELYHIRRYDYLINLVINFIRTILYFNPFVNLLVKAIEKERESSCDEMVIQYQYQPSDYASALLLLGKDNQRQMLLAAAGKNRDLVQRIETILGINKKSRYSLRQISVSFVTLLFIAFMNVFFFANTSPDRFNSLAFNNDINPYYFLNSRSDEYSQREDKSFVAQKTNTKKTVPAQLAIIEIPDVQVMEEPVSAPGNFTNVNYTTPVLPELAKEDEIKLKETVVATKKILEDKEWKELVKSSADVFNSFEKQKLKEEYRKEVSNVDWDKLETQLRLTYNNINWMKVDDQISASLAQMKLDSMQQKVNTTLLTLTSLEKWMKENKITSIPDTDVSLHQIIECQQEAKAQLEKIQTNKLKKVVKL